jgi:hypothetical protein
VCAAAAILGFGSVAAEAAPISWEITYDPANVLFNDGATTACTGDVGANSVSSTTCQSLTFVFALGGFETSTDVLESGVLSLFFYDDANTTGDVNGQPEEVRVVLDGATPGTVVPIPTGGGLYSSVFDVEAALGDGSLTVLLTRGSTNPNNDFYFASSRLTASGQRTDGQDEDPPPPGGVPEPASLLLFGMAATAAALRSRRR